MPALLHGLRHTIARDRPLVLLQQPGRDDTQTAALRALLEPIGYTLEAIFPRSPQALLAVHAERRGAIDWFL